jgi:hypothetical protein
MRQRAFGRIVMVGLVLSGCPTAFADVITLGVFPASQSVALGSPVNVSLQITGLGNEAAPSLGTFDVNLNFDPTILSFNSAVFGDPILGDQLDPTGLGNTISFSNPGFGTVELFDLSLDSASQLNGLQPASFILGSLVFDTIGTGTSALDLTINALGDANGNPLSASLQNGSADVNPVSTVPEPSSALLLAGAAIVMVIRARWSYQQDRSRGKR